MPYRLYINYFTGCGVDHVHGTCTGYEIDHVTVICTLCGIDHVPVICSRCDIDTVTLCAVSIVHFTCSWYAIDHLTSMCGIDNVLSAISILRLLLTLCVVLIMYQFLALDARSIACRLLVAL